MVIKMKKIIFIILITIFTITSNTNAQDDIGRFTTLPEERIPDIFYKEIHFYGDVTFNHIINLDSLDYLRFKGTTLNQFLSSLPDKIDDPLTLYKGLIIDYSKGGTDGLTEILLGIQGIPLEQNPPGWIATPDDFYFSGAVMPRIHDQTFSIDYIPKFQNTILGFEEAGVKIKRIGLLLYMADDISSVTVEGIYNQINLKHGWGQ